MPRQKSLTDHPTISMNQAAAILMWSPRTFQGKFTRGLQSEIRHVKTSRGTRLLLEDVLSRFGHAVTACQDGAAAIDLALERKLDVIFLDIHVQPYNGFEMLEQLRRSPRYDDTPIVALTASVMNEEVQQLKVAGFNGCLSKPVDTDTFPDTLQRIVDGEEIWRIIS